MANKTIRMSRIRHILRLFVQGKSKKQISELTASSRNTIRKYIHKFIQERGNIQLSLFWYLRTTTFDTS